MLVLVSQNGKFRQELTGATWYIALNRKGRVAITVISNHTENEFGDFETPKKADEVMQEIDQAIENGLTIYKIPKDNC